MIQKTKHFFQDIYDKKNILYELAKRDFQQQYMGSYLGFIWVFLQPFLFISVLYTIISFGFRGGNNHTDTPFSVYLISGMIAWLYFAENLNAGTAVIRKHSFLLKKVDFRLSMLPLVKLLSSSSVHVFFIMVALLIAVFNGVYPTLYTLQLIYYFVAMVLLLLGTSWFTSSTNIFIPDIAKIVNILVTFGFWLTPIFWDITKVSSDHQWIIKLNPVYYIVQGYRDSIINHIGFWERPFDTLYFWSFTILTLWIGITVFKKLRPHFAEVA